MKEKKKQIDPKMIDEILDAVGRIKYGEVVITVHDSRIFQIEERKRKRFHPATAPAEQE